MVGGGYYEMTRKQFEWIRLHQDTIKVLYFKIYECKTPKNFHYLYPCKIKMELRGNYFIFSGTYSKWNGRSFDEHYTRYRIFYRNIRKLRYRRTQRTDKPQKLP